MYYKVMDTVKTVIARTWTFIELCISVGLVLQSPDIDDYTVMFLKLFLKRLWQCYVDTSASCNYSYNTGSVHQVPIIDGWQCRKQNLPDTSTHGQCRESTSRPFDYESETLTTPPSLSASKSLLLHKKTQDAIIS